MRSSARFAVALAITGAMLSSTASAGPIVAGVEWYQPADVTGYTWNDFNALCGVGVCNGSLGGGGPDLSGWTWASISEVGDLFAATTPHPGGIAEYQTPQLAPGVDFINDTGFAISTDINLAIDFGISAVVGYSSTLAPVAGSAYLGFVQIGLFQLYSPGTVIATDSTAPLNESQDYTGAWLYRAVPVPGTGVLLALGVALLCGVRRKRLPA